MNFDQLVGKLLEVVFCLFSDVFVTAYMFVVSPNSISGSGTKPGPLTFMVFALIIFVVELLIIKTMAKGTKVRVQMAPSSETWSKGLSKFDPKALLKAASPFVLIVAAHAALVKAAFDTFSSNVSFQSVFSTGCYGCGIVFLVFAVFGAGYVIVFPRLLLRRKAHLPPKEFRSPKPWMLLLVIPPLLVPVKLVHSYFVLLAALTNTSIWTSLGSWMGGTVGFVIAAIWFAPAFSGSSDGEKLWLGFQISSTDDESEAEQKQSMPNKQADANSLPSEDPKHIETEGAEEASKSPPR